MDGVNPRGGWIEIITGGMFSGKSEELIRRIRRAEIGKQRTQLFKPGIDDRFDIKRVVLRQLKLAIAGGLVKADGEVVCAATNLTVGLAETGAPGPLSGCRNRSEENRRSQRGLPFVLDGCPTPL